MSGSIIVLATITNEGRVGQGRNLPLDHAGLQQIPDSQKGVHEYKTHDRFMEFGAMIYDDCY